MNKLTDFNDMATLTGLDSVKLAIDAAKPVAQKTDAPGCATSDSNKGGDINAPPTPPEPLPALPDVLVFDYSYLPDALRGYVRDISERMQCPPDFAAVGVLVMMATIIGRKVGIRPMRHDNWTVICNLWAAVVGNSGVMKSPTLAAALSPIKKLQAAATEAMNNPAASCGVSIRIWSIHSPQAAGNSTRRDSTRRRLNMTRRLNLPSWSNQ